MKDWQKLLDLWINAIENEIDRLFDTKQSGEVFRKIREISKITGEDLETIYGYFGFNYNEQEQE